MPKLKTEQKKDLRTEIIELLKEKTPAIFEREPQPGFAQKNLEELSDKIIELCQ